MNITLFVRGYEGFQTPRYQDRKGVLSEALPATVKQSLQIVRTVRVLVKALST